MIQLDKIKSSLEQNDKGSMLKAYQEFDGNIIEVQKGSLLSVVRYIKDQTHLDILMNLTASDFPDRENRFEVAYEFFSTKDASRLRIKTQVKENEPIDSIVPVWKGANWFEREAYDMYGILFKGHPNLTRILCHHEFVGHPLRKDYEADHQQHCRTSLPIHFEDDHNYIPDPNKTLVPLNIGPSHPATHGTLRVMAELDGEKVHRANVELGFLHRCFENGRDSQL